VIPGVKPQKHGKRQPPLLASSISNSKWRLSKGIVGRGVSDGGKVWVIVGVNDGAIVGVRELVIVGVSVVVGVHVGGRNLEKVGVGDSSIDCVVPHPEINIIETKRNLTRIELLDFGSI